MGRPIQARSESTRADCIAVAEARRLVLWIIGLEDREGLEGRVPSARLWAAYCEMCEIAETAPQITAHQLWRALPAVLGPARQERVKGHTYKGRVCSVYRLPSAPVSSLIAA